MESFRERRVKKTYLALVLGAPHLGVVVGVAKDLQGDEGVEHGREDGGQPV